MSTDYLRYLNASDLLAQYDNKVRIFSNSRVVGDGYNLAGKNLTEINLQSSSFVEISFRGANLKNSYFQNSILENMNFENANLQNANLQGANLQNANLQNANLQGANLQNANLQGAILRRSNLAYADLQEANLRSAFLQFAFLERSNLYHAEVQEADFKQSYLSKANLSAANFRKAKLQGASLIGATVEQTNFLEIEFDNFTKWSLKTNMKKSILPEELSIQFYETQADLKVYIYGEIESYISPTKIKSLIQKDIKKRQGQAAFREQLLDAYERTCAITGCTVTQALEAAHIIPYCLNQNNEISNGLLLRADLHTLFDFNLIKIEPKTLIVHIDNRLKNYEPYSQINGIKLSLPEGTQYKCHIPSIIKALEWRIQNYDRLAP